MRPKRLKHADQYWIIQRINQPMGVLQHIIGAWLVRIQNESGFKNADMYEGNLHAAAYKRAKRLQPWQVAQWTKLERGVPRIAKYWKIIMKEKDLTDLPEKDKTDG